MRGSDTVARYGGDEFVILAGELDRAADAGKVAEKMADMVSVPLAVDGRAAKVGCSIGISVYPDDAEDADELIELADQAMYAAKAAKQRRYAFFSAAEQPGRGPGQVHVAAGDHHAHALSPGVELPLQQRAGGERAGGLDHDLHAFPQVEHRTSAAPRRSP